MSHPINVGSTDQVAFFRAFNTDGSAKTDFDSSTDAASLSVFRVGASTVSIATLSDKASETDAHSAGAIRKVGGNLYAVDLPDAVQSTQVPSIAVVGSFTGGDIDPIPQQLIGFDPTAARLGAASVGDVDTLLPTNFAALQINEGGHVSRVTLVDATTANTDMRGTDNASTHNAAAVVSGIQAVAGEFKADVSALALAASLPSNFAALQISGVGHVSRVTLVDQTTANADMRGTDNASTHNAAAVVSGMQAVAGQFKADVSGLIQYGDTVIRSVVSDTASELRETLTKAGS